MAEHPVDEAPGVLAAKLFGNLNGFVDHDLWWYLRSVHQLVDRQPQDRQVDACNLIEGPLRSRLGDGPVYLRKVLQDSAHQSLRKGRSVCGGLILSRRGGDTGVAAGLTGVELKQGLP